MVKLLGHYKICHKYVGMLEVYEFLVEKIKVRVKKEYFRERRKILKSRLNGGDLVQEVSNGEMTSLRTCSASFISWRSVSCRT